MMMYAERRLQALPKWSCTSSGTMKPVLKVCLKPKAAVLKPSYKAMPKPPGKKVVLKPQPPSEPPTDSQREAQMNLKPAAAVPKVSYKACPKPKAASEPKQPSVEPPMDKRGEAQTRAQKYRGSNPNYDKNRYVGQYGHFKYDAKFYAIAVRMLHHHPLLGRTGQHPGVRRRCWPPWTSALSAESVAAIDVGIVSAAEFGIGLARARHIRVRAGLATRSFGFRRRVSS